MKVEKIPTEKVRKPGFLLLDDEGQSIEEVEGYLSYLVACGSSPNTVQAYAYDLLHFYRFLNERSVGWEAFTPALSLDFFEHLSKMPGRNFRVQRLSPVLVSEEVGEEGPATVLSPNSVNRTMACVSSYFGYLIFSGRSVATTNPVQKKPDPALARVPERRKPFLHGIATKRPSCCGA